jgi:glutamate formiminotransferase
MDQLIECVPNFSEGRDQKVIDAILNSITKIKNVQILNHSSDPDHNRSVITFIGEPSAIIEAAFQACKTASKLINLNKHQGIHPRIGATDVIPLIPLKGINFEESISFAKKLGQKIYDELNIPIFFYEKAAKNEAHKNLANIRNNHHRLSPDLGTNFHPQAGATVVGVRDFLIAFNVNLKSNDLKIAQTIAQKIRESSGGLPHVKALGLKLEQQDCTQISMNLTNYRKTPPLKVFKFIEKETQSLGIEILESELIGLMPKDALKNTNAQELKIKNFKKELLLPLP